MENYGKITDKSAVDNLWRLIKKILSEKKVYTCEDERTQKLLSKLNNELNQIKDRKKRESTYASIATKLTAIMQACSIKVLLSNVSKDVEAAKSAQRSSYQYKKQNKINESKDLLIYAEKRISNINETEKLVSALLSLSKSFIRVDNTEKAIKQLSRIEKIMKDKPESKWFLDVNFDIAGMYLETGQDQSAINVLNKNAPLIMEVKTNRDILLNTLCEHYLMTSKPELAFAFFQQFSQKAKDFQLKSLAQFCLSYNKNFNTAKKITEFIDDPFQLFLSFESWYDEAKIDSNQNLMEVSIDETQKLLPMLDTGVQKFEALFFLANFYTTNNKPRRGKKYLDLAEKELIYVQDGRSILFKKKLAVLRKTWNVLHK